MKKKNKVENSLERLFSAKKSDLVSNEETEKQPTQSTTPAVIPEVETKEQKEKVKKSSKKEKAKLNKKVKAEKKAAETSTPTISEPPGKASLESTKPSETEPRIAATPKVTSKSEPPIEQKASTVVEEVKKPVDEKTKIDKPMTDAIVAKKLANAYDADEHLVIFSLAGQSYGISIMIVESIIKMQDITHVPRAHPAIEGATNLRGIVLPVIDLCKKMDLQPSDDEEAKRIIVVAVEDITAGFIVDNVQSVYRISSKEIAPPSPMVTTIDQKYIKGIAKDGEHGLVIILEPIKIFESVINETVEKNQVKRIK